MTQEEINAIIARHGGLAGHAQPVDAQIPDPEDPNATRKIPNPNPSYKYILKDGTHFTARKNDTGAFDVTDPGTALTPRQTSQQNPEGWTHVTPITNNGVTTYYGRNPATGKFEKIPDIPTETAPSKPTPSNPDQWQQIKAPDGRVIALQDPATGDRVSVPQQQGSERPAEGQTKQTLADGGRVVTWEAHGGEWHIRSIGAAIADPNQPKEGDRKRALIPGTQYIAEYVYKAGEWSIDDSVPPKPYVPSDKPKEGDIRPNTDGRGMAIQEVFRGGGWTVDTSVPPRPFGPQTPTVINAPMDQPTIVQRDPVTGELRAVPNPAYRPAAAQRADELFQSVEDIKVRMARGEMSAQEGEQYIGLLRQNYDAALRGTTPYQQHLDQLARQQARLQEGRSLLNQRVQSGSGLAQSLLSSALGIVGNQNFMDPAAVAGFSPFSGAFGYATALGGGPDVYSDATQAVRAGFRPEDDPASALLTAAMARPGATQQLERSAVPTPPGALPASATTPIITNASGQNVWSFPVQPSPADVLLQAAIGQRTPEPHERSIMFDPRSRAARV